MRLSFCKGLLLILYFTGMEIMAQDVQCRGPNRDGIYPDTMLLQEWPMGGPEVLFVSKGIGRNRDTSEVSVRKRKIPLSPMGRRVRVRLGRGGFRPLMLILAIDQQVCGGLLAAFRGL